MRVATLLPALLPFLTISTAQSDNGIGISPAGRSIINATQAQVAIEGAVASANSVNIPFCISIVDPFGLQVAFLRQDSAYPGKSPTLVIIHVEKK
jgi:uncharacterized protein GlcG (DUF336 family)